MSKISIYAGDPIARALEADEGTTRSGRINAIVGAYLEIVADEVRRLGLSRNEWLAICDVCNGDGIGHMLDESWRHAWASMHDAHDDGIGEKWSIDSRRLAERMRAMNTAQKIAVMETIGRFWARSALPHDDALTAATGSLKE